MKRFVLILIVLSCIIPPKALYEIAEEAQASFAPFLAGSGIRFRND